MAYNVSNGAIAEIVVQTTVSDQTCLNILHYKLEYPSPRDGTTLMTAFLAELGDTGSVSSLIGRLAAASGQDTTFTSISGQWISPIRYRKLVLAIGSSGDVNTPSAQSVSAVTFTKFTDIATRRGIGSFHMVGCPQSYFQANGFIAPTPLSTVLADIADKLSENIIAGTPEATFIPIIYNRQTPADSLEIEIVRAQTTARAMQRRVVGRGI